MFYAILNVGQHKKGCSAQCKAQFGGAELHFPKVATQRNVCARCTLASRKLITLLSKRLQRPIRSTRLLKPRTAAPIPIYPTAALQAGGEKVVGSLAKGAIKTKDELINLVDDAFKSYLKRDLDESSELHFKLESCYHCLYQFSTNKKISY